MSDAARRADVERRRVLPPHDLRDHPRMTALEEPRPRDWWATVARVALFVAVLVASGMLLHRRVN